MLVLKVVGVVLLLVIAAAGGLLWQISRTYDNNVQRLPGVFDNITGERPAKPTSGAAANALNIVLVGSDRRAPGQTTGDDATDDEWVPGAQRTDTIMIIHVPSDRSEIYLISVPRDSWVPIPRHGTNKVNAAFSFGGPTLMVETLEQLTDVRMDHFAIIDFEGFKSMTAAVGGVDVTVAKTVTDPRSHRTFTAGVNHLEGDAALDFVRQRYGLPGSDFDRIQRQQAFMKALAGKAVSSGTLTNPSKLLNLLDAVTKALSVDEQLDSGAMRSLAFDLKGVRSNDIKFITAPVAGFGRSAAGASYVKLDQAKSKTLWKAMRTDTMDEWVKNNDSNSVTTVR